MADLAGSVFCLSPMHEAAGFDPSDSGVYVMSDEVTPAVLAVPATGVEVEKQDEPLGEPGLKALKAEREKAAAAVKQAQELEAKLREYEDRDKSAEERAQERLAEAEKRAVEVELRATRAEVAAATSVPTVILAGPKSGAAEDIQAFADALIEWRGEIPAPRGPVIPGQGATPSTSLPVQSDLEFANFLTGHSN